MGNSFSRGPSIAALGHHVRFEIADLNGHRSQPNMEINQRDHGQSPLGEDRREFPGAPSNLPSESFQGRNRDHGLLNPQRGLHAFDPNPRTRAHLRSSPNVSARTATMPKVQGVATRPVGLLACACNLEILDALELRLVKTRLLD
jgi:hypothetical protein